MNVYQYQTDSPTGRLRLFADSAHLLAILWENDAPKRVVLPAAETVQEHEVLQEAAKQLQAYFAGTRTAFDVPLRLQGTQFQQQVWQALQTIPYGQTRTYKDIAAPAPAAPWVQPLAAILCQLLCRATAYLG